MKFKASLLTLAALSTIGVVSIGFAAPAGNPTITLKNNTNKGIMVFDGFNQPFKWGLADLKPGTVSPKEIYDKQLDFMAVFAGGKDFFYFPANSESAKSLEKIQSSLKANFIPKANTLMGAINAIPSCSVYTYSVAISNLKHAQFVTKGGNLTLKKQGSIDISVSCPGEPAPTPALPPNKSDREIIRNCLTDTLNIPNPAGGKPIAVNPGEYGTVLKTGSDNHIYLPGDMTTSTDSVANSTKLSVGSYSVVKQVVSAGSTRAELIPDVENPKTAC